MKGFTCQLPEVTHWRHICLEREEGLGSLFLESFRTLRSATPILELEIFSNLACNVCFSVLPPLTSFRSPEPVGCPLVHAGSHSHKDLEVLVSPIPPAQGEDCQPSTSVCTFWEVFVSRAAFKWTSRWFIRAINKQNTEKNRDGHKRQHCLSGEAVRESGIRTGLRQSW